MSKLPVVSVVITSLIVFGCSADKSGDDSSGASSVSSAAPTWHQDVRPVIESSCVNCHQEGAVGGFSLETYEDV